MKKYVLIFCLFVAELSAVDFTQRMVYDLRFDADGNAYDLNFDVQESTFDFIESFCGLLFARDSGNITADHVVWDIADRNKYDFEKMESDLAQVGFEFQYKIYKEMLDAEDFDTADHYIEQTVIHPAIGMKAIFRAGEKKLEMNESLIRARLVGNVNRRVINKSIQEPLSITSTDQKICDSASPWCRLSILSSPLFKASCAATGAGVVTYGALRLYNKDKTSEQHYSPIKWSLGAAAIVGAGTYWWLR